MTFDFDSENVFHGLFYGLYAWIAKLDYFACIDHDNVIVLLVEIGFFVVGLVLTELVFANQVAI